MTAPGNSDGPLRAANENIIAGVLARRAELEAKAAPSTDYTELSARLAKRQEIGGVGAPPDNDNDPWPLREQLKREGSEALLRVAERYRAIWDSANQDHTLMGSGASIEATSLLQSKTFNMVTGKDKRRGILRIKGAMPITDGNFQIAAPMVEDEENPAIKEGPKTFKRKPARRAPKKWNGDEPVLASIDSRKHIARLQAVLGPLLEVFEDAVLHGETLAAIGEGRGAAGKASRAPAGRVLVMMGLQAVQDEMRFMDTEQKAA